MASLELLICTLDVQRAGLGARCAECGYDNVDVGANLLRIADALCERAFGRGAEVDASEGYASVLMSLRAELARAANALYGCALDATVCTIADVRDALEPAPEAAYAVTIPAATTGKYELRFLRSAEAPVVGGTYKGKAIAHVFSGFEDVAYSTNSKVPWYSLHADIAAVCFDDEVKPVSCAYWFYLQQNCTRYDLAKLDTSEATSFAYMFFSCTSLVSLDIAHFVTSKVTSINYMFYNCTKLSSIAFGAWDMTGVTVWAQAFRNLTAIEQLDFSRCTLPDYTSTMYYCFYSCSKLARIYVPAGCDMSDTSLAGYCFGNCRSLVGGAGTAWSSDSVSAAMARVDGLGGKAGYFTAK